MSTNNFRFSQIGIIGVVVTSLLFFVAFYLFLQSFSSNGGDGTTHRDTASEQNISLVVERMAGSTQIDGAGTVAHESKIGTAPAQNDIPVGHADKEGASLTLQETDVTNESEYGVQHETRERSAGTTKLFALIDQLHGVIDESAILGIQKHFQESSQGPNGSAFLLQVLEAYGAYTDEESDVDRRVLQELLVNSPNELVGEYALRQLENNGVQGSLEWLDLARDISAASPDFSMSFSALLPDFEKPLDLALGLTVVGSHATPGSAESLSHASAITGFAAHEDERVRAAATTMIGSLTKGHIDYRYILENALTDPSVIVRQTALASIIQNHIRSDAIRKSLYEYLRGNEEFDDQKNYARQALELYELSETEYSELVRLKDSDSLKPPGNS